VPELFVPSPQGRFSSPTVIVHPQDADAFSVRIVDIQAAAKINPDNNKSVCVFDFSVSKMLIFGLHVILYLLVALKQKATPQGV
jgi:hypothetical protein